MPFVPLKVFNKINSIYFDKERDLHILMKCSRLLIVALSLFLISLEHSYSQDIKFEHLSTENGLSSNGVTSIIQDQQGFMWFGTYDGGLNKYDGYTFTVYKNIPGDSTSLSNNRINVLYEDRSGQLWIGTQNFDLCRFDRETDSFIHYPAQKDDPTKLCSSIIVSIFESKVEDQYSLWVGTAHGLNRYNPDTDNFTPYYPDENKNQLRVNVNWIYSIVQDSSNRIWIGTFNEGLFYFDPVADQFMKFKAKEEYSKLFKNENVMYLCATREGNKNVLWLGTYVNGLYKIDLESGQIKNYLPHANQPGSISKNSVYTIHSAKNTKGRVLWIGTYDGFYRFDTENEEFVCFRNEPGNSATLSSDNIVAIMEDRSGILWVGTENGINKLNPLQSNFITFKPNAAWLHGLNNGEITSFCESESAGRKFMWIGTEGGLYKYVRETGQFTHFKHDPTNVNSLTSDVIKSMIISQHSIHKYLWAGTQNGLNKINLNTGRIKRFYIPNEDAVHNYIFSLCEDETGRIWIGTRSTYLYSFNPQDEIFTRHSPPRGNLYCLCMDSFGNLWTGTGFGVEKFHINSGKSTRYGNKQDDPNSISNFDIKSIFEDKNKDIWVGTSGGLNKYDRGTETFSRFTEKNGLPSDVIKAILEDDWGNLWLTTGKGISKFNPVNKTFKNFDVEDGLHGNGFHWGSAYKTKAGEMFFGGPEGFTLFHPDKIKENNFVPPVIISDLQIFNQSIRPGKNSILKEQISDTREITLPYDQSVFSFEFAALDYHNPQKNQYAYQMEGVDPEWVHTDASRRFATYTNLDPGDYTFKVKGSNNDGIWNEAGTSIKVTVLPPWWRTNWAYAAYILFFALTLYALRTYDKKRQRLKHELEIELLHGEKLEEVDHLKSRFFANISHEFRTPLTLILSPVEQMLSGKFKGSVKEQYKVIIRNARRLLQLISQLLDLSKLESGKLKLQAQITEQTN